MATQLSKPLADRVAAGAAFLDGKVPGWRRRVLPHALDVGSCCLCVLGQVFAADADGRTAASGYDVGVNRYAPMSPPGARFLWALDHGFASTTYEGPDVRRALNDLWRAEIARGARA